VLLDSTAVAAETAGELFNDSRAGVSRTEPG
jgi:hypothetical protein